MQLYNDVALSDDRYLIIVLALWCWSYLIKNSILYETADVSFTRLILNELSICDFLFVSGKNLFMWIYAHEDGCENERIECEKIK
jgi:hypothetical protein